MNVLLTGKPGVGKTTLIQRVVQGQQNVSGFFTKEMRERGERVGFSIETFDGKKGNIRLEGVTKSVLHSILSF